MNLVLYSTLIVGQFFLAMLLSERPKKELSLLPYFVLMSFYNGLYMKVVRTVAYIMEYFFKDSFNDSWNPKKSSLRAKEIELG